MDSYVTPGESVHVVVRTDSTRYLQLAGHAGGIAASIHDPQWARAFEDLTPTGVAPQRAFYLSSQPDEATIEVSINGEVIDPIDASGARVWGYNATSHAVVFTVEHAPPWSAEIIVSYNQVIPCEP